jgi:hypothetical protein
MARATWRERRGEGLGLTGKQQATAWPRCSQAARVQAAPKRGEAGVTGGPLL